MNPMGRVKNRVKVALLSVLVLAVGAVSNAATLTVTTTNDSGAGSLREAIQTAASGDTINFSVTGTILLTGGELFITNNLVIAGPGTTNLTVSGSGQSRVLEIGSNAIASIAGLNIASGHAADFVAGAAGSGGGIYNNGVLTLSNCIVMNNRAGAGAGGYSGYYPGSTGERGGGICNAGTLNLKYCTVSGNSAGSGGQGYGWYYSGSGGPGGPGGSGGGIYNIGQLSAYASTLSGNAAGSGGSGGFGDPGSGGNGGTGGDGGAIYNVGTVRLTNCTLSANSGGVGGGGSGCYVGNGGRGGDGGNGGGLLNQGTFSFIACTLSANSSGPGGAGGWESGVDQFGFLGYGGNGGNGGNGGGIYSSAAPSAAELRNTLAGANSAGTGGAGASGSRGNGAAGSSGGGPDFVGLFTDLGHNLIGGNPMLSALADNGGPTLTMAVLPGSPAIDTGDDAVLLAPYNLVTDQRGFSRKSGARADIGAFELQQLTLTQLARNGSDMVVSFSTEIGRTYRVERTDGFAPASWATVADNIAGTGSIVQARDVGGANRAQRFYRARILP